MLSFPNAKLNLGLQITNKRSDGYHDIVSCFVPVGWSDILEITPSKELTFELTGREIPCNGDDNLCIKAYHLLQKDFDLPPVYIHLHKILPIGAGLGGGSSDATHTLKALNDMFALEITSEKLKSYASVLGSDCPFFVDNQTKICKGIGDQMEDISIDIPYYIVMVFPNIHISTPQAYSGVTPSQPSFILEDILSKPIEHWKDLVHNDFEDSIFQNMPVLSDVKKQLYKSGALYASMTGSGSTLYGFFDKEVDLQFPKNYLVWRSWD